MQTVTKAIAGILAILTAASCSLYKEYSRPEIGVVDSLYTGCGVAAQDSLEAVLADTTTIADIGWRDFFLDPCLARLIGTALENNADIQIARRRVIEAQENYKAARYSFIPEVSLAPSASYGYSAERYSGSAYGFALPPLKASWEIDFAGKMYNRKRKARASLEQSEVWCASVQTALVCDVAMYYYTLLKLDAQLEVSRTTATSWNENVRIMKAMKEAGMTNEASVAQTEANACSIEASLYDLEYEITRTENLLSALVGIAPGHIERTSLTASATGGDLSRGVPVQLLSRRADVRHAELELRKTYYDKLAAKAAFYPSLTISGEVGWEKALTSPVGWLVSLGAGLFQPLFSGWKLKAGLTTAQVREQEAAINFRNVLLKAGSEVNNAMALCASASGKTDVRIRQIESLESAVTSTEQLMRHSESTYLEVLTARQSLLSAKLLQISDRFDELQGTIALYRALGGGGK